MSRQFDLVIIGSGPGGYVAAIRAGQLGLNVACIEREERLGGTCLRIGCIPSKAMLESTHYFSMLKNEGKGHGIVAEDVKMDLTALHQRKDRIVNSLTQGVGGLLKKNKVTHIQGHATFLPQKEQDGFKIAVKDRQNNIEEIIASKVIIATGSSTAKLAGVELDYDKIGTSTEALNYTSVPKHLVVIGAGAIGLELGSVWARLGAKVTVLEYADRILAGMDSELAFAAQRLFTKQGLEFRLKSQVLAARRQKDDCMVQVAGMEPFYCDRVLLAAGRVPNTENLGLDQLAIAQDNRGRIIIDKDFKTNIAGIFAIGDVIAGPMLAHKAEEEGVACVEKIVTGYGHVPYCAIPYVVYTAPEVAGVGKIEDQLKNEQISYRKGSFPFAASARARANGDTNGFVKVLAHRETDEVLGVHMIGAHASELIAEATIAMTFGASSEDMARVCYAHPTLSEALKEASLSVDGRTINL